MKTLVTDHGTYEVFAEVREESEFMADYMRRPIWKKFGDECIGVPDIEPFNNLFIGVLRARAAKGHRNGR